MKFKGVIMNEQRMYFAIAVVEMYVLKSSNKEAYRRTFTRVFGNTPIILMARGTDGTVTYQGRPDIVNFLAKVDPSTIPWKEYTLIVD